MERARAAGNGDLVSGWREGREAWPNVEVSQQELGEYVRERGPSAAGPDGQTRDAAPTNIRDLYLACACARGDRAALALFEQKLLPEVDAAVAKVGAPPGSADEARQIMRHRLFVGPAGRPKILEFSGRGELRAWVRIAATRIVLNLATRKGREQLWGGDKLAALVGVGGDPEVLYLKQHYRTEFKQAFQEAFDGLESRERNLLRYAFGDGLTVDAIGTVYGVHRATAARWVTKAQESLTRRLRRSLKDRLGIRTKELTSILRLIESQLELTLQGRAASVSRDARRRPVS